MSPDEIASLIEEHRDRLVAAWVEAVRADETIKSDADISDGGLINHVPVLVEEVCDVLRSGQRPGLHNTAEARVHAYTRYRQDYRARDLIRETGHLRLLLYDHITAHYAARPLDPPDRATLFDALRVINSYLDEELRYAVSIYTEAAPR
jgi:hypothetical protein